MSTRTLRYTAAILLLAISAEALWDLVEPLHARYTIGQLIQIGSQLLAALLGLVGVALLVVRRPLPHALEWSWTAAATVAGGAAPVVWGGSSLAAGLASAAAVLALAFGILWLARRGSRGLTSA